MDRNRTRSPTRSGGFPEKPRPDQAGGAFLLGSTLAIISQVLASNGCLVTT